MTENYSVLMSVYIKEKPEYLKEAITSILNQTVKTNDFVIVCDGPLTEGLNKVIADFVTTYSGLFNVYRLEHNMGLAKALNNGILQCKNEIIVRMDSDDVSMPDRVEKQMKAMKEKNADIVGSNIIEFVGDISNTGNMRVVPENNEEIIMFAKNRSPFNHPSVMYKMGEMKAEQLAETTLNPDTRRLLPVTFGSVAEAATQSIMNLLMAANESNGRRLWMEAYGNRVEADV